ncbi:MAG: hypothetical protein KA297_19960 [Kofleriaceae bacterium]|nr:hypothetical protein [Kofleriaceae bacterium]
MNAVRVLLAALAPAELRALARARTSRFDPPVPDEDDHADPLAWACARWGGDLATALNLCHKDHLQVMARAVGVDHGAELPALRLALWRWGAALEAGGTTYLGTPLQPAPVVLAGHLVVHGPPHGLYPLAPRWPRPLPGPRPAEPPADEPATIDELLAAADAAVGVRLGQRGRDKGAWGQRAAALLGLVERGDHEPDWRGDVEVKTVPVRLDHTRGQPARWRVAEDPAISMVGATPISKLQQVLWLVVTPAGDDEATVLSWYYQRWDDAVARWVRRYLHDRPKGPAGTLGRGFYLSKRFFADAGLLATLNGPTP